jgi:putative CocE/NonD family hydrolase
MAMRDGVVLRADICRPDDARRHPAILFRTPYNKVFANSSGYLSIVEAAFAGYAVVVQDIRGRFASDGEWRRENMFTVEGPDGYDSVEWIASQRWCDGNVGMAGASYLAGLQWAAAMESPPHLKAIAPWMGIWGAGMKPPPSGGAILLVPAVTAIPATAMEVADRLEREGQDVSELRRLLNWASANPEEILNFLPLKDIPFTRFDSIRELWQMRLHSPPPAETARRERFGNVVTPCYYVCGWFDMLEWASFAACKRMQEEGGTERARQGQHILVGPWMHGQPRDFLGGLNFGRAAAARQGQIGEHNLAFFERYLRDRDVEIPAVRYFVMGRNRWQTASQWPLPQTQWQRFYLHSKGGANTAAGDGVLSRDEPVSEPPDTFVYDPHHPVPSTGGRMVGFGLVPGPLDQSRVERRQDVLCYTTTVLKENVEVTGPLKLHLFAATSAVDTDFTAKLVDVHPDGRAFNVVEGIIRASGRRLDGGRNPVIPGKVYEYTIHMGETSQFFPRGHCIRIEISSSNFPTFDRNMNTGNPIGEDAVGIQATQTVFHRQGCASYIDLPVIPDQ